MRVHIVEGKCIGCGDCISACVYNVLHLDETTNRVIIAPSYGCVGCLQCLDVCVHDAIGTPVRYE